LGQGSFEIERRYLVRVRPGLWREVGAGVQLRQGYVKTGTPSVRIRLGEPRGAVLTCKAGSGVRRREVEAVVPFPVAEALFEAAGERIIEKVRFALGPWELDRFQGGLEGLTLLEIELGHEEDPVPAPPTGVRILRDVTDDKRFTSSALSRLKPSDQRKLVRKVYEEVEA
jgi:CYTH domain-containing protein